MAVDTESPPETKSTKGINSKLGPLPIWMWALGAGGAFAVFLYWRSKNKKTAQDNCPYGTDPNTGQCIQSPVAEASQIAVVPMPVAGGVQQPPTPTPGPGSTSTNATYTVQAGDSWDKIAKKLGMTSQDLFYYQFADAATTSAPLRTKLAEFGPTSIIAGNVISYPTTGQIPKYQGFNYWTSSSNFWPSPGEKAAERKK